MSNEHVNATMGEILAAFNARHASASKPGTVKPLRAIRVTREPGCEYCAKHRDDPMMPPHQASSRCESGKRSHCTCDTCW